MGQIYSDVDNWDEWANIRSASLYELVALSLDLQPWEWEDPLREASAFQRLPESLRKEFSTRLMAAFNHWNPPEGPRAKPTEHILTLVEFGAWAESLPEPWDLPARFPRASAPPHGRLGAMLESAIEERLRPFIGLIPAIARATARHAGKDEALEKTLEANLRKWVEEGHIKTRNEVTGAMESRPSRVGFQLLHIDDVNAEFERQGVPWRCPPLVPSTDAAPDPQPRLRSTSRHRQQEEVVLAAIASLGQDATALPAFEPGRPGVKAKVREQVGGRGDFAGQTVFDKAWERLRQQRRIAYAKKGSESRSEVGPSPKSGDRGRVAGEKT